MSNVALYEKTKRVLRSCNSWQQFEVADRYYKLAIKRLPKVWIKDLYLHYINTRQLIRMM